MRQYAVCLGMLQDGQVELGVLGCPNLPQVRMFVCVWGCEGGGGEWGRFLLYVSVCSYVRTCVCIGNLYASVPTPRKHADFFSSVRVGYCSDSPGR